MRIAAVTSRSHHGEFDSPMPRSGSGAQVSHRFPAACSIVTSVAAFDFDGILCQDAESGGEIGAPLYLPRREPIHIITGRRERDREVTLAWLHKWHVRVAGLTMMVDDLRESAATVQWCSVSVQQRLQNVW